MRIDVFSIFPEVMQPYLEAGVLGRAQQQGLLSIGLHDLRDYTSDRHRTTDDEAYGGGGGMIMKPEPIFAAVEAVLGADRGQTNVVLLSPQGRKLTHAVASELAAESQLGLICGRYEGVDERVRSDLATDEISIGDYVLSGGELPALVLIDAVARFVPGVVGDESAPQHDSHSHGLLEHPHYTRPADFRGLQVPNVLRSGDHGRVAVWRRQQAILRTARRRPELLDKAELTAAELAWLEQALQEGEQHEAADEATE